MIIYDGTYLCTLWLRINLLYLRRRVINTVPQGEIIDGGNTHAEH